MKKNAGKPRTALPPAEAATQQQIDKALKIVEKTLMHGGTASQRLMVRTIIAADIVGRELFEDGHKSIRQTADLLVRRLLLEHALEKILD